MNCVQRLNRNLHQLAPRFHHFVNYVSGPVNNSTPLPWNSKASDALNFVLIIEPNLSNQHGLPHIRTYRMLRVDNSPRVALEYEHRSGAIPEAVEEVFELNFVSYLRKRVYLFKSMIDLLLILLHVNFA